MWPQGETVGSLNFIGGEKGGVGKSVMARILAQYFIDQGRPFTGFDTDRSHQSLRRFYAEFAFPTAVDNYESLDAIVESFADDATKSVLVDLAAQTFAPVACWIEDSDLFAVFGELDIPINFWHVMDGGKESVDLLGHLFDTYGNKPNYIIVINHGRGSDFSIYENSYEKRRAAVFGATTITLPKLHEASMRKIDLHDTSFWGAVNNKSGDSETLGLMERQRVKVWLQKSYESLSKVKL
jgi:hypothetical protein